MYTRRLNILLFLVAVIVVLVVVNPSMMDKLSEYTFKSFDAVLRQMDKFCVNYQLHRGVWKDADSKESPKPDQSVAS